MSVRHERQALGLHVEAQLRRAPCLSPTRRSLLKALITGLCALVLCATPVAADARTSADLGASSRGTSHHEEGTSVIRFFDKHRWLLTRPPLQKEATSVSDRRADTLAATQAKAAQPARARAARRRRRSARGSKRARALAREGDLPRLRRLPQAGAPGRAMRVRRPDDRAERPVPRPVPDGLERAPAVRPRGVRARAGTRRVPLLRPFGTRLEPVVLQAVELTPSRFVRKLRARSPGTGFPPTLDRW